MQRSVSLSFSVLFLSAISCVVYDPQLSLSFPWARFTHLNTLDSVLAFIGIVRRALDSKCRFFLSANKQNLSAFKYLLVKKTEIRW